MSTSAGDFNAQVIDEFRANGGTHRRHGRGTPLLLLHHTGAKSGTSRINPGGISGTAGAVASNGGAPTHPGWYHNLKTHPDATIEVGTRLSRKPRGLWSANSAAIGQD
jgi:deazaflavin-dependent oxidoreductase (nitroreductase family)